MNPFRRFLELLLLALAATCVGCAVPRVFIDIPAVSTPQREARYVRTQPTANFAAGAAVDELARLVIKGPRYDGRTPEGYVLTSRNWTPAARVGTVILLGGIRRQFDKGYREGGWLMNALGALADEVLHISVAVIRGRM